MPQPQINLDEIYSLVCNRKNKGSTAPGARAAAHKAAEKAKLFIDTPNFTALAVFREAEEQWAIAAGGKHKSYGDDFERALRSGNYYVHRRRVNSASNRNNEPIEGYIYGALSLGPPGWMKLGSTTESPLDRIAAFARHYGLQDVVLMYHARVAWPRSVEDEIGKCLRTYRRQRTAKDSREWFDIEPQRAMQAAQDAITRLGVKVFTPVVESPQMKKLMASKVKPTVWIRHGGRLAQHAPEGGKWGAAPTPSPDLIAKVAARTSSFHVGEKVVHRKLHQYGVGIVFDLNQEGLNRPGFQGGPLG